MKKIFVAILLCSMYYSVSGKVTDTISYWHVQFNKNVILELHQGMESYVLRLNTDTIGDDDIIGIRYSPGCLICSDCKSYLAVYTMDKRLVQYEDATGHWTPIRINFRRILIEHDRRGESIFDLYFLVGNKLDPDRAVHVLRVQLE